MRNFFPGMHDANRYFRLIPGYNAGGQTSSLMSMQGLLVDASEQVSSTLRMLSLKAHEGGLHKDASLNLDHLVRKRMQSQSVVTISKDDLSSIISTSKTLRLLQRLIGMKLI